MASREITHSAAAARWPPGTRLFRQAQVGGRPPRTGVPPRRRPHGGPGGRATVPTVHRCVVLRLAAVGALAACQGDEPATEAPGAVWVTPPGSTGFPLGALRGRLGRSQAPQPILALGIASGPGF